MFDSFRELCKVHGRSDRVVISNEDSEMSLTSLEDHVRSLIRVLSAPTGRSMILLALPGGPHFTAVVLASLGSDSVVAPVPSRLKEAEVRGYLELVHPDIVVVETIAAATCLLDNLQRGVRILSLEDSSGEHEGHEVLGWNEVKAGVHAPIRAWESCLPADTAMIQFTSGSTSQPKGILISHANLLANQLANREYLASFGACDVYCPIPQFHAMGGAVVLEHLLSGCAVHVSNQFFLGDELARMRRFDCRAILASPNYVKLLLRFGVLTREQLPDLDVVVMGTAPVECTLVEEIRASMPNLEIHVRYGLSEVVGTAARVVVGAGERLEHVGLVGGAVEGLELSSGLTMPGDGEPTEIQISGPTVAVGEITAAREWKPLNDERGFLRTGDLGYRDAEGRLHLRGRSSTFLKANGYRISPFEIESVLRSHKAVQDAVVVGVPDALSGERIVACLESAPGQLYPGPGILKNYCEGRLSSHKVPKEFRWLSPLPRTAAGKPDRRCVQNLATDGVG